MARKPNPPELERTMIHEADLFTDLDIYLFKEGNHFELYKKLGSHLETVEGVPGARFAVWAPNAVQVSVIGDFNGWNGQAHPLSNKYHEVGIWEGFIPGLRRGERYKYLITPRHGQPMEKGDPYAFHWEVPPRSASVVWDLEYEWGDQEWMENQPRANALDRPFSVYEVHLGSWQRVPEEDARPLTYRELAPRLAGYVREMGFTHVEFMPVMEHPFYGSWGYQVLGYFAPSSRFGTPQDFMYLIDYLHQQGIGVLLDWVPSHFPHDPHGLVRFDGTYLYEHMDPKKGFHPEWKSHIFNHGRYEVRNFLISNARFWLDRYHADGLRVDAVASMLYLDYARREGEWIPNEYGGKENIDAIWFLRRLNEACYGKHPGTMIIAEESTSWPMVSRPTFLGGLGFGMKWNMGWMHDTLYYFSQDPIYRKFHHHALTFSLWYAFTENFMLPLSHDEVVHGKGSLIGKMPGDWWQKFANLRALFGMMYTHPGKKLLFMGCEFGQWREWDHDSSLDWHLLELPTHQGLKLWVQDLNHFYREQPALWECDFEPQGFQWVDFQDWEQSVVSFLRRGRNPEEQLFVACNLTPVPRYNYVLGVPLEGFWREALNSDAPSYGGSGHGNFGGVWTAPTPDHGFPQSITITLPPLGICIFKHDPQAQPE